MRILCTLVIGVVGSLWAAAAWATTPPAAVSPGSVQEVTTIDQRCPSFSWSAVKGAQDYELVVYRVGEDESAAKTNEPLLRQHLPGGALSWTPSTKRCLSPGGRYAWLVRAQDEEGMSGWSEPRLFEVAAAPPPAEVEQALAVLEAYLAAGGVVLQERLVKADGEAKLESEDSSPSLARTVPVPEGVPVSEGIAIPDLTAIKGEASDPTGVTFGVHGISMSSDDNSTGVVGESTAGIGATVGVLGQVQSAAGVAGAFDNTAGGTVLSGRNNGVEVFSVDGAGDVAVSGLVDSVDVSAHAGDTNAHHIPPTTLPPSGPAGGDLSGNFPDPNVVDDSHDHTGATVPDQWVDEAGDTMTGTLTLTPGAGNALEANADINLASGNVLKGGMLFIHDNGINNTALGISALISNTTGYNNTASGFGALQYNTTGKRNTALGYRAGRYATAGDDNIFLGSGAEGVALGGGAEGVTGEGNTIRIGGTTVGTGAKQQNRTFINGIRGAATGQAGPIAVLIDSNGQLGTSGPFGEGVDADKVDGFDASAIATANTLLALNASALLPASITGNAATATTATSADTATSAATATALAANGTDCPVGQWAAGVDAFGNAEGCTVDGGIDHSFSFLNTRVGLQALVNNTTGKYNTASGATALVANTTGNSNTASGLGTLYRNTTGHNNTAIGSVALFNNTEGNNNTAIGYRALVDNTTGGNNTASGFQALRYNTMGSFNTASGNFALYRNTIGNNNTASGSRALYANTSGNYNAVSGSYALLNNTEGDYNTANGFKALQYNTTGNGNTASGFYALQYNTTGKRNTALGYRAGRNATFGDDNIFIGSGAEGVAFDRGAEGVGAENHTIRIGGTTVGTGYGQQQRTFINGIVGTTTGVADAIAVLIDSNGQLGTVSSSRRYKEEIEDMGEVSHRLLALRPVTFRYMKTFDDGEKPIQFGLIAEEVAEVFPELVVYDEQERPETVKYHLLSSLLLNELQKQASVMETQTRVHRAQVQKLAEVEQLEARLAGLEALQGQIEALTAQIAPLKNRLAQLEGSQGTATLAAISP